ncbi:MAG TPA: Fe-S cluster assembly protein SufD [Gammaproteobacteria bacterium]
MNASLEQVPEQLRQPLQHFQDLIAAGAAGLPGRGSDWLDMQRVFAVKEFLQHGFPTRADEEWRYTSLERVLDQPWSLRTLPSAAADFTTDTLSSLSLTDKAAARLVFLDGRWNPALSELPAAAAPELRTGSHTGLRAGLRIGSLRNALETEPDTLADWLGQAVLQTQDPGRAEPFTLPSFAAFNTALLDDGAWIRIPAGLHLDGPIELIYLCTAENGDTPVVQPRNLIVLEDGAAATVVEHYAGQHTGAYFTNALTEVLLGDGAQLEHVRLQDESPGARHLSNIYLRQGAASRYRGYHVSLGALWSRTEFHNPMAAEQAHCALDGLYIAGDRQLTDVHLDIDHAVPECSSRERFKGVLIGRGRAVFDGRIRVRVDAQKTDAQLSNDNLLLSRDAEIDTKPQLEIYADDVKCSHGTTVGQLEPAQIFYLRARGIGLAAAQRMLCMGFATELLEGCSVAGLRDRVEQRLAQRLNESITTDIE